MLCLSDFELYSPGVLHLFSQSKPIAFMPFSLPSPSSLLKLPSITFATWGGGGGRGGEAHLPLNHMLNPTQIIQNNLCVVRWHKETSQQSLQHRSRLCHRYCQIHL